MWREESIPRQQISALALLLWVIGTPLVAFSSKMDPLVEAEARVKLPNLPARALDPSLTVGLYFPTSWTNRNPTVYFARRLQDSEDSYKIFYESYSSEVLDEELPARGNTLLKPVMVDLATPTEKNLVEIFRRLFPRAEVYRESVSPQTCDVIAEVEMSPRWIEKEHHVVRGLEVVLSLQLRTRDGQIIDDIKARGAKSMGDNDEHVYWSLKSALKNANEKRGGEVLQIALAQLTENIQHSKGLSDFIRTRAEGNTKPTVVDTVASYDDSASILPNGTLDAGEKANIVVEVTNRGPGPAFDITAHVAADNPKIIVSGNGKVGKLGVGEKRSVTFNIAAPLDLAAGILPLRIETLERRGYGGQPVVLEVRTRPVNLPKLEIVDIRLNDLTGRARGDGDGQPANGETIEALVRVRNSGAGDAAGVAVALTSTPASIEILEQKVILPRISADSIEEARLLFRLPWTLESNKLGLTFQAVDARGATVGSANETETWSVRLKRPNLDVAWRLFDGNSPNSTGNRNGRVNNGETVEIAIGLTNRGELPARAVKVSIEASTELEHRNTNDSFLLPKPAMFDFGDLPPQAESQTQRFTLTLPRNWGDRETQELPLQIVVTQRDFPPNQENISLRFEYLEPSLVLDFDTSRPLIPGRFAEIIFQVRNPGSLRAENLVFEISSETKGLDLLDEKKLPTRKRRLELGGLDPLNATSRIPIAVYVRRGTPPTLAALRLQIEQKEFPRFSRIAEMKISDEPTVVIPPAGSEMETVPLSPAPANQATISFLRHTDGEHVTDEAMSLEFEVQTTSELADLRITQNGSLLRLADPLRSSPSAGDKLRAERYKVTVPLAEGGNVFEVVAITREGVRSSRSLSIVRDRENSQLWVVAIGISNYADPGLKDLQFADADARSIYQYFHETFQIPDDRIFLRVNERATLREIKNLLGTQLPALAAHPNDTVILYFAGHGMKERVASSQDTDGLTKYLLPYDADRSDPYSTAIAMDELVNILHRLIPERVVVLLDSCFSGAAGGRSPFDPRAGQDRVGLTDEYLERMVSAGKGRAVLTASGPNEVAQERPDLGHGIFTYYLLEGLRGAADLDRNGEIDVQEIFRFTSGKVAAATLNKQHPVLKAPESVGQILVGRSSGMPGH